MCRALKVLCVANDRESLVALKKAASSAEWELAPGAITADDALRQLESERPHVVVAFGSLGGLIQAARKRHPGIRVIADRDLPGADVVATSLEEVREAVMGRTRPGGPVR